MQASWLVGGSQNTQREPTHTQGEQANSTLKGPRWGLNLEPSRCEATVLTTTPPCSPLLNIFQAKLIGGFRHVTFLSKQRVGLFYRQTEHEQPSLFSSSKVKSTNQKILQVGFSFASDLIELIIYQIFIDIELKCMSVCFLKLHRIGFCATNSSQM